MKLINRDADYAIKALVEIAGRGGEVTAVPVLTGELGLPRPYLRKILQTLARGGVVRSARGQGGGFTLARPAAEVRLADVIRVFQGPVRLHDCVFKRTICPDVRTCPLRKTLTKLEARFVAELEGVTISALLAGRKLPGKTQK